jgi:hypothetical protein
VAAVAAVLDMAVTFVYLVVVAVLEVLLLVRLDFHPVQA